MKTIKTLTASIALAAIALACVAQEEEEAAPELYTYATYFNCGGGPLAVADAAIAKDYARMDAMVEAGKIEHWGWLAHHTGGQWQRIQYYQAKSIDALLDAYDAMEDDGDDDEAGDGPTFGTVCNRHDDYIWQAENGNPGKGRGATSFSVYYLCDSNREDRADEIVAEHMAPILNKLVEGGKLNSWGWSSHVVGGRFRKLQTMTAANPKALMAARGEVIAAMYGDDNALGAEFTQICGPHDDYVWNVVHEK